MHESAPYLPEHGADQPETRRRHRFFVQMHVGVGQQTDVEFTMPVHTLSANSHALSQVLSGGLKIKVEARMRTYIRTAESVLSEKDV